MENKGTDKDVMPEGYGEFGLEITNPIPVHTVAGNQIYLERLHTADGVKVTYKRIGSMRAPNIPSIIDGYTIFAKGKEIATLYICPYNKKNSEKAPKGFQLAPEAPPEDEPVFFDIPKPGAAKQHVQSPVFNLKPPPPQKRKRRTKINGFTLSGGVGWAAMKYFFVSLTVPVAIVALMEYQWNLLSAPPSGKFLTSLPFSVLGIGIFLCLYGMVGLVRRRYSAFAEFLQFIAYVSLMCYFIRVRMIIHSEEIITTFEQILYWICVFALLIFSLSKLLVLKNASTGKTHQMNFPFQIQLISDNFFWLTFIYIFVPGC